MNYNINKDAGISNRGNIARIQKVMRRAEAGEEITLGFIGGSITQGSLSSTPQTCYAYLTYTWWQNRFPNARFKYVNAGIGGTTSQFGVARADMDLLSYGPDMVIVEFSVNDDSTEHFRETYEGLIRKIYTADKRPALMIVHNVRYDDGGNAQIEHSKIARHYDIPAVSMQSSIYPKVVSGEIPNRDITPDDLHPNDEGHRLVSSVITNYLQQISDEKEQQLEVEYTPAPLTADQYENSIRYQNYNIQPECTGFTADNSKQSHITECFKNGWEASELGAKIHFDIVGTGIAVQFRKSVNRPTPVARVIVDDDIDNAVVLDGNFDEDWGDCLYIETITRHQMHKLHTVDIEIIETHKNDQVPFYLVSVIGSY